jgi:hypothetical protein
MKKVLGLILLILLLATFSDRPPLLAYKQQLFGWFSTKTQTASQIKGEQSLALLQAELQQFGVPLGLGQQQALQQLSQSVAQVLAFEQQYCLQGQFHPLFYGESIGRLCQLIAARSAQLSLK